MRKSPTHRQSILQWRMDLLVRHGVPAALAHRLSLDRDLDVTAMVRLVRDGCPPHLAERILAPLDRPLG